VLASGATNHMAAGGNGFTVKTSGSGAKVTLAHGHKMYIKGHGYVSMDVGSANTKVRIILGEAMLVPDLTDNLLSVRAVDRRGGAVVFVGDACYIRGGAATIEVSSAPEQLRRSRRPDGASAPARW